MMLTISTTLKKCFHFANCCHSYVDINAGKEKIGFILNMISRQRIMIKVRDNL